LELQIAFPLVTVIVIVIVCFLFSVYCFLISPLFPLSHTGLLQTEAQPPPFSRLACGLFVSTISVDKGTVLKRFMPRARGPIGRFVYDPEKDQKHLVMVAAGSGVTPFISIMRELCQSDAHAPTMDLIVSFRTVEDIICAKELDQLL
jgi:hypothetical protein